MKKLFAILLTVALLCTLSVSAFAATVNTTGSETSKDLTVKYTEGTKVHAHAATIEWGSMEFTYTAGAQTWNTESMKWEYEDGAWSEPSTVKVSNKSSEAITVKFGFVAEADAKGVTGITVKKQADGTVVGNDGCQIEKAKEVAGGNGTATECIFTVQPTGTYTGTNAAAVKVGSITITLA